MIAFVTLSIADFPVWLLQRHTPMLCGHELLVQVGGKIVACSETLRQKGVQCGWSSARAQAHAPEALVRPLPGPALHALYWEDVLWSLNQHTPWIESSAPGLAVAAPVPLPALRGLARRYQARIGVAGSRSTSLLAAVATPPGRVRHLTPAQEPRFRQKVPLSYLSALDVDEAVLQKLAWLGFETVGSMARLTERQLVTQFGLVGRLLYDLAQGAGVQPVSLFVPPPTVTVARALDGTPGEPGELEPVLRELVEEAAAGLGPCHAQSVTLRLETSQGVVQGRRLLRTSSAGARTLHVVALAVWRDLCDAPLEIEKVVLVLGGLIPAPTLQTGLWERRPAVTRAVEKVESRFPGSLFRMGVPEEPSYLPEEGFYRINPLAPASQRWLDVTR